MKKLIRKIISLFPTPLPMGVTEFHVWADDLIKTFDFPTKDEASIKFALTSMIMHLGPTADRKAKYYFAKCVRAGAAKQIASSVFYDIKIEQQKAEAARIEAAKQQVEATTEQKELVVNEQ